MKVSFIIICLMLSSLGFAQSLLKVKKNFNQKNVLVYSAVTQGCKLAYPYVTAHWHHEKNNRIDELSEGDKKLFNPLITENISDSEVRFTLNAADKVKLRPEEKIVTVKLTDCIPHAYLLIDNQVVQVKELFVDLSITLTLSVKVNYLEVDGKDSNGLPYNNRVNF